MALQILEDEPQVRLVLGARNRRIVFDRRLGVIVPRRWRWLRARRIPVADVDRIRMTVARDHSIDLAIRYRRGQTIAEQDYAFEVRDLDLDHEALDLAFRIAQICRLGGYLVRSESQDARTIDLVPQAPDDTSPYRMAFPALRNIDELASGAVREVPPVRERADYRAERGRFREPESPSAPPGAGETVGPIRVVAWDPPRIELDVRATITKLGSIWSALGEGVALLVAWLIPLAAVAGFEAGRRLLFESGAGFYSWKDYTAWTITFVLWICFGAFAIGLFVAGYEVARETARDVRRDLKHRGARRIAIDRETIVIETTTRGEIPTRDIDGVVLRTYEIRQDRWYELELVLAGDDVLLAATQALDETAQANLQALAIGIAQALDVPYRIEDPKTKATAA